MLEDAAADILAFYAFPAGHWRDRSSGLVERSLSVAATYTSP
jgi:hypothetical protein